MVYRYEVTGMTIVPWSVLVTEWPHGNCWVESRNFTVSYRMHRRNHSMWSNRRVDITEDRFKSGEILEIERNANSTFIQWCPHVTSTRFFNPIIVRFFVSITRTKSLFPPLSQAPLFYPRFSWTTRIFKPIALLEVRKIVFYTFVPLNRLLYRLYTLH